MHRFALAAFALTTLVACQPGTTDLTEDQKAEIAGAIEQRVEGYMEAVKRYDADWLLNFWADVDGFVYAEDGNLVFGHDAIANPTRDWIAALETVIQAEFSNGHTFVLAPDAACHTTEYQWSVVTTEGDTLSSRGSWTYVFKQFDGEWKVVHSNGGRVES
jgi:ketosteroid isomerase-like protein